ncbi:MAG: hypothetical protein LBL13_05530 [Bacteroidales bacterium]|jgi:hypothetical protein|nr:hypothetical protein [Bacteroidales bacterium]
MSYSRSYRERISVHYSGTVSYSYPASEHGGSGTAHYSGTTYEDVNINLHVDTNPFDRSVANCNTNVNLLTGAVVATEAAQIASIDSNAKKVGQTIVDGFFKTIRSEISQQIMELSTQLDATLMHLHELAKRCVDKQRQMETDYNRISSRYIKTFDDLNNELENRIFELDKPAFVFKRESDKNSVRTLGGDLVSVVSVFGREGGELQVKISASIAKKRALDTIGKANTFLLKQKKMNSIIHQSMLNENRAATQYSPVCYMETGNEQSQIEKQVYQSDFLPKIQVNELIDGFKLQKWDNISKTGRENIQRYFNAEISSRYVSADSHENRVKENILKMLNSNLIKSI